MILALFDSDGTLYTAQFGRGLMKYSMEHGRKFHALRYYASVMPTYLLYQAKLVSWDTLQRKLIAGLSAMLQGLTPEEARPALTWLIHEYLLPTQRPEVFERLRAHQAQGHAVVVVSAMLMPAAEILGQAIQATAAIGSTPELIAGRYTGRSVPPIVSGPTKPEKVHALVQANGWEVDWAASHAYGDSFADHHMLALAGHAVAVHPDAQLFNLAREKGWEVLGTARQ